MPVASKSQGLEIREIIYLDPEIFFFSFLITILTSLVKWHLRSIQISKLILSICRVEDSLVAWWEIDRVHGTIESVGF